MASLSTGTRQARSGAPWRGSSGRSNNQAGVGGRLPDRARVDTPELERKREARVTGIFR